MPSALPSPVSDAFSGTAPEVSPFPELDAMGFGVFRLDSNGLCDHANPAALALLGFEAREVVGCNLHDLIHHSHPDGSPFPQSACALAAARLTGRPARLFNEMLWRRDGSFLLAEVTAWPLPGGGSVVTVQDSARQGVAQDRLALQVTVSRMLAGTADLEDVLPRVLGAVGTGLGAQAAFFWALSHRERRPPEYADLFCTSAPLAGCDAANRTERKSAGMGTTGR